MAPSDRNDPQPQAARRQPRHHAGRVVLPALAIVALALHATAAAATPSSAARSAGAWRDAAAKPAVIRPQIAPRRFRALTLDRAALAGVLEQAPRERIRSAPAAPLTISLPAPGGGFERFAVARSPVMEPGLAARHPEIATYRGTGLDTPGATVRLDLTPLGLHASIRGPAGVWYVDPYNDQSLYASYRGSDLTDDPHGAWQERDVPRRSSREQPFRLAPTVDGPLVTLRTYRLALVSDPAYAAYHGAENVTAAKATLVNRVNQIYEEDLGIHLSLVAGNDALNLDTDADMTGAGGPCGDAPCYSAGEAGRCGPATLNQTRIVIGQLVGAANYDVGHIAMGVGGGGSAYSGVVGSSLKAGGCTGLTDPVGDLYAVDYVAHELGHQFDADHTFDGIDGACAGRGGGPSVEPGSGSTVMAYAGLCDDDNLQSHSDPYFSQRSIDQIARYVAAPPGAVSEVQTVSLREFEGSDAFRLAYDGVPSGEITNGVNYSAAGIAAAIKAIAGFPAAATATVTGWGASSESPGASGFTVTFGGSLAGTDVPALALTSLAGTSGFVGETTQGGKIRNGGTAAATSNHAPVVQAPAAFTIPAGTPFVLAGSATDADGDTLTYLWEQDDPGTGRALGSSAKTAGPLFRVFGTAADVTSEGTLESPSPGENAAGTEPVRVFPDLAQVVAGNTNAATGFCPDAPPSPAAVDCHSEFLPTSAYARALHFRLTARDGHAVAGGTGHADATLAVAPAAGPFRVTSQAAATSVEAGAPLPVTWSVAGTDAAPVSTASVRITMSTDGGLTFPKVVTRSTPNDGSKVVYLPNADTTAARLRAEAIGNVFFDVNRADFTVTPGAPVPVSDAPADGVVAQYSDAATATISATDENTPGSALSATATGLPAGLTLGVDATSSGGRSWKLGGSIADAPGTYPVEIRVDDATGHLGLTWFDVVVTAEDALATYAGDTLLAAPPGASTAPADLRFTVRDGSAATDATPGDVANATVTFVDGATVLCAGSPVVTDGDTGLGTASCAASLTAGTTHRITGLVGGHYAGSAAGDVRIDGMPLPPAAPPPPPLPPPHATPVAQLVPDLARVATRLRISTTGRVAVKLRCRTIGTGTPPSACAGTLRLRARIGRRTQTIAARTFRFPATATRAVRVRLKARARSAVKRPTPATLTATVANAASRDRRASKRVRILPARR